MTHDHAERFVVKRQHFNHLHERAALRNLSHSLNGAQETPTATVIISDGHTITVTGPTLTPNGVAVVTTTSSLSAAVVATTPVAAVKGTTTSSVKARVTTTTSSKPAVAKTTGAVTSSSSSALGSSTASPSNATTSTSKSHTGIIAAVVVVILVLLGLVGAFFGYRRYKKNRAAGGSGIGKLGGNSKRLADEDDFGNSASGSTLGGGINSEKSYGGVASGAAGGMMASATASKLGNQLRQSWDRKPVPLPPTGPLSSYPPVAPTTPGSATNLLEDEQNRARSPFADPPQQQQTSANRNSKALPLINETRLSSIMQGAPFLADTAASSPFQTPASTQGPFMDSPEQGKILVVKNTFEPTQADELIIYPGDRVQLLVAYDDGWALGINLDSGNPPSKGVFPFDCVGEPSLSPSVSQQNLVQQPFSQPLPQQQQQQANERSLSPVAPPFQAARAPSPQQQQFRAPTPQQDQRPLSPQQPRSITPTQGRPLTPQQQQQIRAPSPAANKPPSFRVASPTFDSAEPGPPQLAPLRTDSPLWHPAIQVHSTEDVNTELLGSPTIASELSQGAEADEMDANKAKRSSSLVASKDAGLFMALGDVMGKDEATARV